MKPLMLNDIDPLPTRLGLVVKNEPPAAAPAPLTTAQRAWVDAYETTERDMAARPQRFYSQCSAADPLGQRVRRREAGDGRATGGMTDDEAREIMTRSLGRSEHCGSFLSGFHIDDVYALYLADVQAHEREYRESELLERIKSKRAVVDTAKLTFGFDMGRPGGDMSVVTVRQGNKVVVTKPNGSVAEQLMDRVRGELPMPPPAPKHVLVVEGQRVPMGPGAALSLVIKDDPDGCVWRVLDALNGYVSLERHDGTRKVVHIAQLAHDIPF